MKTITEEIEGGRHAVAARELRSLLAWDPIRPGPSTCWDLARGRGEHRDAAAEAWARVPPASRFAVAAILGRMELDVEGGRLADAERLILQAVADPRIDAFELALEFGPVYAKEGRVEDAQKLIECGLDGPERGGPGRHGSRRFSWSDCTSSCRRRSDPVEAIRSLLDRAGRFAPEDDRVWLGKANLAIRTGSLVEAGKWLDACLRRRPDDVSVWRARLDWAMASNRLDEALEAMRHLPAVEEPPARAQRWAAWLAAADGDPEAERARSESVIRDDPTDFAAYDRLIELAIQDGQPARADELRRKKSDDPAARGRAIRRCIDGTSRPATPRRWLAWRNSSAVGSRPGASSPWQRP